MVEFVVAPIGGRVFNYLFPEDDGIAGMIPDIPFYHWGYATVFALGAVVGIAIYRLRDDPINEQWKRARARFARDKQDGPEYNVLSNFFLGFVAPAWDARMEFQEQLIKHHCSDDAVAKMAIEGMRSGEGRFQRALMLYDDIIDKMESGPPIDVTFSEVVECIHEMESSGYMDLRLQADRILDKNGYSISINDHETLFVPFSDWKEKHAALVDAFEVIKKDTRMGKLYRPIRPSRW